MPFAKREIARATTFLTVEATMQKVVKAKVVREGTVKENRKKILVPYLTFRSCPFQG